MSESMKKAIVTTGHKVKEDSSKLAKETAARLGFDFVERGKASIEALKEEYKTELVLVAKKKALVLVTPDGELFFHPNMAHLRVKNIRLGQKDHMIEAMELRAGMSVLDCTLGFGADAIVASFVAGPEGSVTGLEVSPLISEIVGYGLTHFIAGNYPLQEAMRRINVVMMDYLMYLQQQSDKSVDIVYLDPMFRYPLKASINLQPLRCVAEPRAVSIAAIEEAKRVARCRVVMKENSRSLEFKRLGMQYVLGGKYSSVHYGVIDL
ncbi:MAG: class I SAM-dependent methyltransferase [Selenomonadaceae bacterium]